MSADANIHASAVLIGERGVLVRGASGSGKSSLVYSLIEQSSDGNRLIADDRVDIAAAYGRLIARVPVAIAGKLELRGVGVVSLPFVSPARIHLVVDLLSPGECPRLPEPAQAATVLLGVALARLALPIGAGGHEMRVRAALAAIFG